MAHTEYEELRAMRMISRGQGLWPLQADGDANYDEAYVTFDLEHPDLVTVYLRKNGESEAMYSFRLQPHVQVTNLQEIGRQIEEGIGVPEADEPEHCECCGEELTEEDDAPSDDPATDVEWGPDAQGELGF